MPIRTWNILLAGACLLLVLSFALPLFCLFGGSMPPSAFSAPASETLPSAHPAIHGEEEEMRGLWIATVNNINFPSKQGLSADTIRKELADIVAFAAENGFNTILFQVRPAADALYDSEIFPASKFLSGKAGTGSGVDCLDYLCKTAQAKGIRVYAWVNPLRVTSGNATYPQTDLQALPASSPAVQNPDWVVPYADGKLYFDVGIPAVRELVSAGVREICENYPVDGIVFDDYFYPYPVEGATFDDADTYAVYGEGKALADFRRESVNALIALCYRTVKDVRREIAFGVSPFGIWQNGDGENGGSATSGLSAYDAIYCDALAWANGGYVDFLAPQIYWNFDTEAAPFDTLAAWWSRALDGTGVTLYINHGVYRYAEGSMQSGEITRQAEAARTLYSVRGGTYYGYAALQANAGGVTEELQAVFAPEILYFDYIDDGTVLTVDSYKNGDSAGESALITGVSNLAYPISVNGVTPLRTRDGRFSITLALSAGDNLITVRNGEMTVELLLHRE